MTIIVKGGNLTRDTLTLPMLLLRSLMLSLPNPLQKPSHYHHPQADVSERGHECLVAKCIGYKIGLLRVLEDLVIVIIHHIYPSSLSHVQIWMVHQVPQTLVIQVNGTTNPIEVMSPNLEGKNKCP